MTQTPIAGIAVACVTVSFFFLSSNCGVDGGILPPTLPRWPPTYNLSRSTLTMVIQRNGWSSPTDGGQFGVISYDWSNAKVFWAKEQPMDCEERLVRQAQMTKRANAESHVCPSRLLLLACPDPPPQLQVWVYRNLVKALPWFSSVRRILDDPAYSGFFLRFNTRSSLHVPACAAENSSKCSTLYHDQLQTPEVPTAEHPHPDGSCPPAEEGGCDCGLNPCGEYLWDHRNGSQLRNWLIQHQILGSTGLGHESIDGLFVDDFWCSDVICNADPSVAGCPCTDPVQGPTEVELHNQLDMGLTDGDIADLTRAWNETMGAAQQAILDAGGFTWSLMRAQHNANANPTVLSADTCLLQMRAACAGGPEVKQWQDQANLVGLKLGGNETFAQLQQDVAFFLLVRGPFAWLGWGEWGMCWPLLSRSTRADQDTTGDDVITSGSDDVIDDVATPVPRPPLLDTEFGHPVDKTCWERPDEPGVFARKWSVGDVDLDCNAFRAVLPGVTASAMQESHVVV